MRRRIGRLVLATATLAMAPAAVQTSLVFEPGGMIAAGVTVGGAPVLHWRLRPRPPPIAA